MKKVKLIIVGFGSRGQLFGGYALDHENTELVAIADVNPEAREKAIKEFGIKPENCFKSADEIFCTGKSPTRRLSARRINNIKSTR